MINVQNVKVSVICDSCAEEACCSSELIFTFLHVDSSIQNKCEQFVSYIHTNIQKPNGVSSGDSNRSISVNIQNYTHAHMNFFSHNDQ